MLANTIPLSLYIHFPWCVRKCPYCDFNSHTALKEIPENTYIEYLIKDLERMLPSIWGRRIISIFMGGGTPSLFSPAGIDNLLTQIHTRLNFSPDIEITMEANPGTLDERNFAGYRSAGINRLSIGVQSFNNDHLKALGRIHDAFAAEQAITKAKAAGFTNFNIDLMHGLPQQSIQQAQQDLQNAIALEPTHISWYQLTIEPNTVFYKTPPPLPPDDALASIQEAGAELLQQAHYLQYEVSAYSQPDKQCQHNRNYWEFGDYLGIGAGAHSKLTDLNTQAITRIAKIRQPKDYMDEGKGFIAQQNIIPKNELPFEFMLNALRLYEPITVKLFMERTGLAFDSIDRAIQHGQQKNLLLLQESKIILTSLGRRFLNDVVELFLV